MSKLAELRAKLKQEKDKSNNRGSSGSTSGIRYPFWNTPVDTSTKLRFLPDSNPDKMEFWVEKLTIKIPFQGIKGENHNECYVTVPCMETYGKTCPIQTEIRPMWSNPETENIARTYYKKRSYIFQGFVISSEYEEDSAPENPIRIFEMNKTLTDIIKASLMDPEMDEMPTDYDGGCDFVINVTKNGQFKNYATSSWARKNRSLNDAEREAVDNYGLNNLADFLPKEPTEEEVKIIQEMFEASLDNEQYDPARWGHTSFRPYGLAAASSNSSTLSQAKESPKEDSNDSDEDEDSSMSASASALAKLRRKKA